MAVQESKKPGLMSRRIILGTTVAGALIFFIVGIIFWGGFNTAMEATNNLDFCISCHEMEANVYEEYKPTIHYSNRTGVRATCPDCHVPDPWVHKMVRKIQASNEVLHKILGTVDTPEKFDQHRLRLARNVWKAMKSTDSRECRNCHDWDSMNPENQKQRSAKQHIFAMEQGQTCIDCHKGIAHKKAHDLLSEEEVEELEKSNPAYKRELPPQWVAYRDKQQAPAATVAAPAPVVAAPATEAAPAAATAPAPSVTTTAAVAPAAKPAGGGIKVDWSKASSRQVMLFYPGQTSMEWALTGSKHGGARVYKKVGDRCFACHEGEQEAMGTKMVTGEKAEDHPIPGKRPGIPVTVQATHDGEHLFLRFSWPDTAHVPVPFVDGGMMDKDNPVKLAMMLATDEVQEAGQAGCWGTCHHDANGMPDAPAGKNVTKYIAESRTEISTSEPMGGWDKRKAEGDIGAELQAGHFMDLLRYKAGSGASEDGHILAERVMDDGQGVEFVGEKQGDNWVVSMKRKLNATKAGDLSLAPGQLYNIGFAIHDDHTNGRFHHVSLGYKLGLDNAEAEINATRQ
jgi:cytochrome c-type protein NapC